MSKSVCFGRFLKRKYKCSECNQDAEFYACVSWTAHVSRDNYEEHEMTIPLCKECLDEKLEEVQG